MRIYISPILNFKIDENAKMFNIYDPKDIESLFSPNFLHSAGSLEISRIMNHKVWLVLVEENSESSISQINEHFNNILCLSYWLIKDCACSSPIAFLFDENGTRNDLRDSFYSNSSGKFTSTKFTINELNTAESKFDILTSFLSSGRKESDVSESGNVLGSANLVHYNDFHAINRAVNFITFARSTSFITQKIAWYVVFFESLFGISETESINFKMSYRVAHFLDLPLDDRLGIFDKIKLAYSIRSSFIHGSKLQKKHSQIEFQETISNFLDDLARKIINEIIHNEDRRKLILDPDMLREFFHKKFLE
ncbi:hypothetical protein ABE426_04495 [Sphingobacterium faecium]|uniref:hypothetical protein n=1 Tax=Sphingobacterium faecium TaxID=34087 RepID=UPI00320A53F2